jgi:hypothetical protein
LVLNWKIDALSRRALGLSYLILFVVLPLFFGGTSLWFPIMAIIVLIRSLYLLDILDYISKKMGG